MNSRKTETEEWTIINEFKIRYTNFPKGDLLKSESPDFLISTGDKMIGIEITRIYHDSDKKSSEIKKRAVFKSSTTDRIISEFSKMVPWTFIMNIEFDPNKPMKQNVLDKCIGDIASFCAKEFSNLENRARCEVDHIDFDLESPENASIRGTIMDQGFRNLPYGVQSIQITRWDDIGFSWNSQNEGGGVPNLTMRHLARILEEKETKLRKFKPCDEQWLLITGGDYYYGSFNEVDVPKPLLSSFHKVFFFRYDRGEVFELK